MATDDLQSFGAWLRQRREAIELTRKEVAWATGCSISTIRKIEAGDRRPSKQVIELLATCLEITPAEYPAFIQFARENRTRAAPEQLPAVPITKGVSSQPFSRSMTSPSSVQMAPPEQIAAQIEQENLAPWPRSMTNLPAPLTSFVGRGELIDKLRSLLWRVDVRLIALTGPGGVGKTRLSVEAAAGLLSDFADGIFFVSLAPISDPALVISAIAQTLGVQESQGHPLADNLSHYLAHKNMLLLLDNFEQVADAAPQISRLLGDSPGLKVLVTSREKLNLYGEHEFAVSPLSLPDIKHLPPIEKISQYEAVRLFTERGQAAKADFVVTNNNARQLAEICVRLDGLPLAIELAAARVKMLPPDALLARLASRLRLLTGGARDLSTRQRTLRGTIEWSYDLLSGEEKQLFRRLAVFHGGRTLQALEKVCNFDGQLQVDPLDGMQSLLDKNLVQQREGSDKKPRFRMLETIHEYAREKLVESGEAGPLQRKHAHYYMRLTEEAEPHLRGSGQQEWLDRLEDDYDNIRAALAWAVEQADVEVGDNQAEELGREVGLRTAGAIWRYWYVKGLFTEGREHLEKLLSKSSESEASEPGRQEPSLSTSSSKRRISEAKALNGAGNLAWRQGDYSSARALFEKSLALRRELGDRLGVSGSLNNLGIVAYEQGDYARARALYEESLTLKRELGDKLGMSGSLGNLGIVAMEQGDYSSARSLYEEGLALGRELDDKWGIALSLGNLGIVAMEQGDYASARALHEESLALYKELGDTQGIALSLGNLGTLAVVHGDFARARALHEEGLALLREIGAGLDIVWSLSNLGIVAMEEGDYTRARALHEEGLALSRALGTRKGIATCLAGLGGVTLGEGLVERGAKLLGAAGGLLQSMGAVLGREDRLQYERNVQQARVLLGGEAFTKAWAEGQAMTMDQVIAYWLNSAG